MIGSVGVADEEDAGGRACGAAGEVTDSPVEGSAIAGNSGNTASDAGGSDTVSAEVGSGAADSGTAGSDSVGCEVSEFTSDRKSTRLNFSH